MAPRQSTSVRDDPVLSATSVEETLAALQVDTACGLTQAEVTARLRRHGPNEVPVQHAHPVVRFVAKFWGLSAWMLELIMLLSWVLRKEADLLIVGALLVVNAVISFLQEHRASAVLDTLRQRLQVNARVQRDGVWRLVPARSLVPGDIVRLRPGDFVPADVQVITGMLGVDQAAVTGESLEADKGPGALLYSGSVVRRGEANGVVLLTGTHTSFGRTTKLVQQARPKLHLEEVVATVVRWLFVIVGTLLSVVCVIAVLRGSALVEVVPLLLVLLMSAVPVALPVMFTVSMAVGARELAQQGVLVTRLSAAEDAATMDVLCVDKTGTITMNQLRVAGVVPLQGWTEREVLFYGALASQEANQDPIDLAFLAAAQEQHLFEPVPAPTCIRFMPFDPTTRRTEALVEQDGQRVHIMKGAVTTVAQACRLAPAAMAEVDARTREQARRGYRVLAVAHGAEHGALTLVGLVTLSDPPRPDASQLIAALRDLGVAVKMLTGFSPILPGSRSRRTMCKGRNGPRPGTSRGCSRSPRY